MNLQTFLSASCAYLLSELSKLSGGILPGNEQPPQIESAAADWIIHRWTGHVLAAGGWKEYRTVAAARSDWQRVKILESQKVVSLTRRPRQSLPVHFIQEVVLMRHQRFLSLLRHPCDVIRELQSLLIDLHRKIEMEWSLLLFRVHLMLVCNHYKRNEVMGKESRF